MSFYTGKKVLVTGGTGLIGRPLAKMLVNEGAEVTVVSLYNPNRASHNVNFMRANLRQFSNCMEVCEGKDIVFHLAGVKGSNATSSRLDVADPECGEVHQSDGLEAALRVL